MQAVSAGKGKEATRRLDGDDQHAMRHSSVVNLAESRDCSVRTTKQTRKETQPEGAQSVQNAMLMMGVAGQRPGSPDARGSLQHAGAADALLELEGLGKSTYVINSLYAALIECGMLRMYVKCFVSLGCSVARVACAWWRGRFAAPHELHAKSPSAVVKLTSRGRNLGPESFSALPIGPIRAPTAVRHCRDGR